MKALRCIMQGIHDQQHPGRATLLAISHAAAPMEEDQIHGTVRMVTLGLGRVPLEGIARLELLAKMLKDEQVMSVSGANRLTQRTPIVLVIGNIQSLHRVDIEGSLELTETHATGIHEIGIMKVIVEVITITTEVIMIITEVIATDAEVITIKAIGKASAITEIVIGKSVEN